MCDIFFLSYSSDRSFISGVKRNKLHTMVSNFGKSITIGILWLFPGIHKNRDLDLNFVVNFEYNRNGKVILSTIFKQIF